jgi:hypothetical protein
MGVSLKPSDAVDDTEVAVPDIVLELRRDIQTIPPADNGDNTSIHGFPNYLRTQIHTLARKVGCSQEVAVTYCLLIGLPRLWQFHGITEIESARDYVAEYSDDPEDMQRFDQWQFDIPTMNAGSRKFQGRIPRSIRSQYAKLADILGLDRSKVAVLATMATLIDAEFVRETQKREMYETLLSFGKLVRKRAEKAKKILASVKDRMATQQGEPEVDYIFNDVVQELQ